MTGIIVLSSIFGILFGVPVVNCTAIAACKKKIKRKFTKMMKEQGYDVNKEYLNDLFQYSLRTTKEKDRFFDSIYSQIGYDKDLDNIKIDDLNLESVDLIDYSNFSWVYIYGCVPIISVYYLSKNISFLFGDYSGINRFYSKYFNWNNYKNNSKIMNELINDSIISPNEEEIQHISDIKIAKQILKQDNISVDELIKKYDHKEEKEEENHFKIVNYDFAETKPKTLEKTLRKKD